MKLHSLSRWLPASHTYLQSLLCAGVSPITFPDTWYMCLAGFLDHAFFSGSSKNGREVKAVISVIPSICILDVSTVLWETGKQRITKPEFLTENAVA